MSLLIHILFSAMATFFFFFKESPLTMNTYLRFLSYPHPQLHIDSSAEVQSPPPEEKEVDFFKEHQDAKLSDNTSHSDAVPIGTTNGSIPKHVPGKKKNFALFQDHSSSLKLVSYVPLSTSRCFKTFLMNI